MEDQKQKKDAGKPLVSLILGGFRNALEAVARVGEFGMRKYTRNGWDKVDNWRNRYGEALGRHGLEVMEGVNYGKNMYDPETHLLSELAAGWNALALAELKLREGVPMIDPAYADTKPSVARYVDKEGYKNGVPVIESSGVVFCKSERDGHKCQMTEQQHSIDPIHSDGFTCWYGED